MSERGRILIVDDQRDILDLTSTVLTGAGYDVVAVTSGARALEELGRQAFGLVLLDINMPVMDGWQTLRMIRADDALAGLPVVMFSVKGEFRDKVHSMQEGALDYITKPFVVDVLLERVGRVFHGGDEAERDDASPPVT